MRDDLLGSKVPGFEIRIDPTQTRYFLEASSVSFRASVEYGLRTLAVLARYRLDERGTLPWALLRRPSWPRPSTTSDGHPESARC